MHEDTISIKEIAQSISEININIGVINATLENMKEVITGQCTRCTETTDKFDGRIRAIEMKQAVSNGIRKNNAETKTRMLSWAHIGTVLITTTVAAGVTIIVAILTKLL